MSESVLKPIGVYITPSGDKNQSPQKMVARKVRQVSSEKKFREMPIDEGVLKNSQKQQSYFNR